MKWLVVLLAAVLPLTLAGCGSTTTITTVAATPSTTQTAQQPAAKRAKLGDALLLHGPNGLQMTVTVQRVVDPAPTDSTLDTPPAGSHYVGVFLKLSNTGQVAYNDAPGNGATLISTSGQPSQNTFVSGGPCASGLDASSHIAPGYSESGCIPFAVPDGQTPALVQFTLASGLADQTAQWTIDKITAASITTPTGSPSTDTAPSTPTDTLPTDTATAPPATTDTATSSTSTSTDSGSNGGGAGIGGNGQ